MPAKIRILGPDNIWKYKEVTPLYAEGYFTYYVTSALYPVVVVESMGNTGLFTDIRQDEQGFSTEEMTNYGLLTNILKETTIVPVAIQYVYVEEMANYGIITNILKETVVVPVAVPYTYTEEMANYGILTNILKEEVAGGTPLLYTQWPADQLSNYGIITSITKETA